MKPKKGDVIQLRDGTAELLGRFEGAHGVEFGVPLFEHYLAVLQETGKLAPVFHRDRPGGVTWYHCVSRIQGLHK